HPGHRRKALRAPGPRRQEEPQRQREVKVLLYGERPRMRPQAVAVALHEQRLTHHSRGWQATVRQPHLLEHERCEEKVKSRIDLQSAPDEKPPRMDAAVA